MKEYSLQFAILVTFASALVLPGCHTDIRYYDPYGGSAGEDGDGGADGDSDADPPSSDDTGYGEASDDPPSSDDTDPGEASGDADGDGDGDAGGDIDGDIDLDADGDSDGDADADGDSDGDTDGDGDVGGGPDASELCHESVVGWSQGWSFYEERVVELINAKRGAGASCGGAGYFGVAGPVSMEGHLRCAARFHSLDMGQRDYFSHDSPGGALGSTLDQRLAAAGYSGWPHGEDIAAGQQTPEDVVQAWMESDGHCAVLMDSRFVGVGVGYAEVQGSTYLRYWTMDFGG